MRIACQAEPGRAEGAVRLTSHGGDAPVGSSRPIPSRVILPPVRRRLNSMTTNRPKGPGLALPGVGAAQPRRGGRGPSDVCARPLHAGRQRSVCRDLRAASAQQEHGEAGDAATAASIAEAAGAAGVPRAERRGGGQARAGVDCALPGSVSGRDGVSGARPNPITRLSPPDAAWERAMSYAYDGAGIGGGPFGRMGRGVRRDVQWSRATARLASLTAVPTECRAERGIGGGGGSRTRVREYAVVGLSMRSRS